MMRYIIIFLLLCSIAHAEDKVFNLDEYTHIQYKSVKYTKQGFVNKIMEENLSQIMTTFNQWFKIDDMKNGWNRLKEKYGW